MPLPMEGKKDQHYPTELQHHCYTAVLALSGTRCGTAKVCSLQGRRGKKGIPGGASANAQGWKIRCGHLVGESELMPFVHSHWGERTARCASKWPQVASVCVRAGKVKWALFWKCLKKRKQHRRSVRFTAHGFGSSRSLH